MRLEWERDPANRSAMGPSRPMPDDREDWSGSMVRISVPVHSESTRKRGLRRHLMNLTVSMNRSGERFHEESRR